MFLNGRSKSSVLFSTTSKVFLLEPIFLSRATADLVLLSVIAISSITISLLSLAAMLKTCLMAVRLAVLFTLWV